MNESTKLSAGKDVVSFCNKCKLALSHIVIAMGEKNEIVRVQCNTCKSVHKFKDPAVAKVSKVRKKSSGSKSKSSSAAEIVHIWKDAMKNKQMARTYSIKEQFVQGDIIQHPKFGFGVVHGLIDDDKIIVVFEVQEKTLVHNR